MKQQVIFFPWAVPKENWDSYYDFLWNIEYDPYEEKLLNWNKTLWKELWDEYEYLRVPYGEIKFADYTAWKIMFEKLLPFIRENPIIVSTSLGSSFILKYIWENEFPRKIKKLFLIAPAIHDTPQEKLGTFWLNIEDIYYKVSRWAEKIYIYHSRDDDLVPFEQSLHLATFFPEATFRDFDDRGHFFLEEKILELEEDIQRD